MVTMATAGRARIRWSQQTTTRPSAQTIQGRGTGVSGGHLAMLVSPTPYQGRAPNLLRARSPPAWFPMPFWVAVIPFFLARTVATLVVAACSFLPASRKNRRQTGCNEQPVPCIPPCFVPHRSLLFHPLARAVRKNNNIK